MRLPMMHPFGDFMYRLRSHLPRRPRLLRGQGLIEFALVAPILLVLILGSIEMARLLAIFSSVSSAARQAARYGSVSGNSGGGVPYFLNCAGIRSTARGASALLGLADTDIVVEYDRGSTGSTLGSCDASNVARLTSGAAMTASDLRNGYRHSH